MHASRTPRTPKTPEYLAWQNMRARARQSSYVERGITVCERWSVFANFLADMGERPEGLSLGRIDNDGNFEPGNCHWTTWSAIVKSRPSSPASLANLNLRPGGKPRHGHARDSATSRTYTSWKSMIRRTTNPNAKGYSYYAGRGIAVCERWRGSFENFLADMGERPEGLSLDRENNDGGYWCGHCAECVRNGWPANCRWADWSTQMKNRRQSPASLANLTRAPGRVKAAARRAAAE